MNMKYNTLKSMLLVCFSIMVLTNVAEGQKKVPVYDAVLIYDGISGTFIEKRPTKVREGSIVTIKYININPFILQKGMKSESISHDYNEGMDLASALISTVAKGNAKSDVEKKSTDTDVASKEELLEEINKYKSQNIFLSDDFTNQMTDLLKNKERRKKLNALYKQKETLLSGINGKLASIQDAIITINRVMYADTSIKLAMQQAYNRSREAMSNDIALRISMGVTKPADLTDIFYRAIADIRSNSNDIEAYILLLEGIDEAILDLKAEGFGETITKLKSGLSELTKLYTGDNLKTITNNVSIIVNNYVTAISAEFWAVDTLVAADGDYLVLSNPKMGINPFKIKTHGGTRVDFSVGIAALYGDVNGWNYTLTRPNDSTMFVVTDKEPNQVTFNPVVFTHIYRTGKRNANWMASVGLSPDVSDLADTKLYLGLSLGGFASGSFARRLIFTAGVTAGHTDILKKKYREVDQSADRNLHSFGNISDSDLTQKAIKGGAFFAISWNLGGVTASEK